MAARKSAKNKSASSADPVIIDGQAEDVKVQESGKDAPNTQNTASQINSQTANKTSGQTSNRKSPATVIAGLALFVALLASGGVGGTWCRFVPYCQGNHLDISARFAVGCSGSDPDCQYCLFPAGNYGTIGRPSR